MANLKYEGTPLTVRIGESSVVEVPPRVLRARLTGLLFETDKAFLLPSAMRGIRALVDLYNEQPDMRVVVTGHADRVGGADYNLGLSKERAQSIAHFLKDEVDGWMKWYQKQPYSQAWGVREDQHMMSAITDSKGDRFYNGPVHGKLDPPTRDSFKRFQASRQLAETGSPDDATRRALVKAYMELDDTTLPAAAQVELLGCGENHNEVPTADGVEEEANRRVEIFLFDGPPDPAVPARCPGAGCPYETWKQRLLRTIDVDENLCELLVEITRQRKAGPVGEPDVDVQISGPISRSLPTDESGRAWFRNLVAGRYTVLATKEGFYEETSEVEVRPGGITE